MDQSPPVRSSPRRAALLLAWCALCLSGGLTGCTALTNPVAEGVPVRRLPPEVLGGAREATGTIPLTLLRRKPECLYRLAAGDTLGVWIPGVVGEATLPPPAEIAPAVEIRDQRRLPPAVGYPIPVGPDGTVTLPLIPPVPVAGLTMIEAQAAIRQAYIAKGVLRPEAETLITLLHPREAHIVVMRQESGNITLGPSGQIAGGKRGTGHLVDLKAGENDILHALAQTGGLPGLDAYDEVIIHRSCFHSEEERPLILGEISPEVPGRFPVLADAPGSTVNIPLRQKPGEPVPFRPEDVELFTGDVVFIEARDPELWYSGGLLPAGEHVLPRDRDLDVVQAITEVQGSLLNGAFAVSNLSGALIEQGIGNPSPSLLTVLRKLPGGGEVPIRVDLNKALCDARERILVQPGDVLILQETPGEALSRWTTRTFLNFSVTWQFIHDRFIQGVLDTSAPNQIPGRIGITTNRVLP
jgi:protein involved in polysaccharide export with SLBB domain